MNSELKEGKDFYYNEKGYIVFTAAYLLKKEECCGNACTHCPYNYTKVPEPARSRLIALYKIETKIQE